jgi:hypothetical protein
MTSGIYKRKPFTAKHKKNMSLARLKRKKELGYINSPKTRKNISLAQKGRKGKNANAWKGDKAKEKALHKWIRNHKSKPQFCEFCNKRKPYDIANIKNHKYTRNLKDYKWACKICHSKYDFPNGIIIKLKGENK